MEINNEFKTSADLETACTEGVLVEIYTDYKEHKDLEGQAKLLHRKSKGLTFMLHNENLFTKLEDRVVDHKTGAHMELTKEQKESNVIFIKLKTLFTGVKKSGIHHVDFNLYKLYNKLKKEVNKDLDNPKKLWSILESYRTKWAKETDLRKDLFEEYDNTTIIKFIQQTCIPKWCYSMWREETWLVEFKQDYYSGTPFRTYRKLRTLICVSPDEEAQKSEIVYYATKDETSISKADNKEAREAKSLEDEDEEDIDEVSDDDDTFIDEYYRIEEEEDEDEDIEDVYQSKKIIPINELIEEEDYDEED